MPRLVLMMLPPQTTPRRRGCRRSGGGSRIDLPIPDPMMTTLTWDQSDPVRDPRWNRPVLPGETPCQNLRHPCLVHGPVHHRVRGFLGPFLPGPDRGLLPESRPRHGLGQYTEEGDPWPRMRTMIRDGPDRGLPAKNFFDCPLGSRTRLWIIAVL